MKKARNLKLSAWKFGRLGDDNDDDDDDDDDDAMFPSSSNNNIMEMAFMVSFLLFFTFFFIFYSILFCYYRYYHITICFSPLILSTTPVRSFPHTQATHETEKKQYHKKEEEGKQTKIYIYAYHYIEPKFTSNLNSTHLNSI